MRPLSSTPLGPGLTGVLGDDTSRALAESCWPGPPDLDDDDRWGEPHAFLTNITLTYAVRS